MLSLLFELGPCQGDIDRVLRGTSRKAASRDRSRASTPCTDGGMTLTEEMGDVAAVDWKKGIERGLMV